MLVSTTRRVPDPDAVMRTATELPELSGACYTFRATRAPSAMRNRRGTLDFTDRREDLLADRNDQETSVRPSQ